MESTVEYRFYWKKLIYFLIAFLVPFIYYAINYFSTFTGTIRTWSRFLPTLVGDPVSISFVALSLFLLLIAIWPKNNRFMQLSLLTGMITNILVVAVVVSTKAICGGCSFGVALTIGWDIIFVGGAAYLASFIIGIVGLFKPSS